MKLILMIVLRRHVSTPLSVRISSSRSTVAVCRDIPVVAVNLLSTLVPALPASTAPSATTWAPVRVPTSPWSAPTTTKSARDRSAFAAVQTAKCARGVLTATVPELDSPETCVTRMWMSVRQTAVSMAGDVPTRRDRMSVTVQRQVSTGRGVTSTLMSVELTVSPSAIITVSNWQIITDKAVQSQRVAKNLEKKRSRSYYFPINRRLENDYSLERRFMFNV